MAIYHKNNKYKFFLNGEKFSFNNHFIDLFCYVSLGDSIAAGHSINGDWATDYGEGSQYGKNGNLSTAIVPGCYTDRINNELLNRTDDVVRTTSFARSGDTVEDLIKKLSHDTVINAIKTANLVTICIGANDVLEPAMSHLDEYINTGDLSNLETIVECNLNNLSNDEYEYSYYALFERLNEINPDARYIFTTIYNPYKYLWIDEGTDGFFKPILNLIPPFTLGGISLSDALKNSLLNQDIIQMLFDRVNGLGNWAEIYVTALNDVLTDKIASYKTKNTNFAVTETKHLFDGVPDRPISTKYHYNDLVSVEYTKGYDTADMDWGRLWNGTGDDNAVTYWTRLMTKYGWDFAGLAEEFVTDMIEYVITPDIDPHPETYGHYCLFRAVEDVLGWKSLDRYEVTYAANGGSGTMAVQSVLSVDGLTAYAAIKQNNFIPGVEGYRFNKWVDVNDTSREFMPGDWIGFSGGLPLQADWTNIYYLVYRHNNNTGGLYTDEDNTGPMDCYALRIGGTDQEIKPKLGTFDNDPITYEVEYGSKIEVYVTCKNDGVGYKDHNGRIYLNGTKIVDDKPAYYTWNLLGHTDIKFEWVIAGSLLTLDAQSWWDCYVTTTSEG